MRRSLFVALLAAACATPQRQPVTVCLERVKYGTPEARYHAALELATYEGPEPLQPLRDLLDSKEPLTRNAAARALCDRGEWTAATALVANLDRTARTFVCTDAIYHLRALYGTDLGYNPNLGYRHQTVKQREWWIKVEGRAPPPEPVAAAGAEERLRLRGEIDTWSALDADAAEGRLLELWDALAARSKSRDLEEVALREHAFARFAAARPGHPDVWNNYALAALNNGHHATAERAYSEALRLRPGSAQLHNDIGILLEGLGRLEEAEASYREAVRLAPADDVAVANLADVLAARGRTGEARATYLAAEQLAPQKWYYHRLWLGRLSGGASSPR